MSGMRNKQIKMIEKVDQCLSLMRTDLLNAKSPSEKKKHMDRIDGMLDQRILMMKIRDGLMGG